jgi:catechol 2,3-dioxygenase-like lactoylglutathione lyase family enzyme
MPESDVASMRDGLLVTELDPRLGPGSTNLGLHDQVAALHGHRPRDIGHRNLPTPRRALMSIFTNAYSSFSVLDLPSTQAFYRDVLGLQTEERDAMLVLHLPGGAEAVAYPKGEAHQPATFTVLNLVVDDVPAAVVELRDRGVVFERYHSEHVDEHGVYRGIGPVFAWCKDPSGNVLAVCEKD